MKPEAVKSYAEKRKEEPATKPASPETIKKSIAAMKRAIAGIGKLPDDTGPTRAGEPAGRRAPGA